MQINISEDQLKKLLKLKGDTDSAKLDSLFRLLAEAEAKIGDSTCGADFEWANLLINRAMIAICTLINDTWFLAIKQANGTIFKLHNSKRLEYLKNIAYKKYSVISFIVHRRGWCRHSSKDFSYLSRLADIMLSA